MSIQISLNGLSFCILNRSSNRIEFLQHKSFNKKANPFEVLDYLKQALETYPQLKQTFSSVQVIYQNELSNLVPKELFNEDHLADYLKFNSKILKSDYISYDEIAVNKSVNVYVPYMNINNFIFDTFGVFEYKHASTILIDSFLQKENDSEASAVFMNVNETTFELIAIKNNALLLYNSFEFSTKEDVIYYLLFTMEQLKLSPESVKLKLMGQIVKDDDIYNIIYTYVRHVEFYQPKYSFDFNEHSKPSEQYHHAVILNSF